MPAQKSSSPVDAKLAALNVSNAVSAHKDTETDFGFGGDLPAGINGGIAQLAEIKTGEYKSGARQGKVFVRIAGVVKSPEVFNGERIENRQAAIMIPLCDDAPNPRRSKPPKTLSDHVGDLLMEFKKLGAEEAVKQLPPNANIPMILSLIGGALLKAAPHFKFRTYAITDKPTPQNPNPTPGPTNVSFHGFCAYESNGESTSAVQDNSGNAAPPQTTTPAEDAVDWAVIGEGAENGDESQQAVINAALEQHGLADQCASLDFIQSAALIAEAEVSGGASVETNDDAEAPADNGVPEVGQTWQYKPKGARAPVEAQVTVVFAASKKVNLKLLGGSKAGTVVRSVSWNELQ